MSALWRNGPRLSQLAGNEHLSELCVATPLFRPTIDKALNDFVAHERRVRSSKAAEHSAEVVLYLTQFLNVEGRDILGGEARGHHPATKAAADGSNAPVVRAFSIAHLPAALPAFVDDLSYQEGVLPPRVLRDFESVLHRLARWLLFHEYVGEQAYFRAIEALPKAGAERDEADVFSSLLFDFSREQPPVGRIQDEVKDYVEIMRVRRGVIHVVPVHQPDKEPLVRVPMEASMMARAGWWIDCHLLQIGARWHILDVGSVFP